MRTSLLIVPALLAIGGCAASPERIAAYEASQAAKVPAASPVGKPVNCIQTTDILHSRVRNDSVIDFEMRGRNRVYRNVLPASCPGLGFEERFAYRTSINQLCSVDTITVLRTGGVNGPTCGLGDFQPVTLASAAN